MIGWKEQEPETNCLSSTSNLGRILFETFQEEEYLE